jgi:hypothetical protein
MKQLPHERTTTGFSAMLAEEYILIFISLFALNE